MNANVLATCLIGRGANCSSPSETIAVNVLISFATDKEPTKENIEKIEKLLESSKEEKSLSSYYANVKFIRAEVVLGEE